MKVVILAGGFGTRLSEETDLKPKPMVEIGGMPILWHIMKIYSFYGFNDFIICLGYKGYVIKDYFYHYYLHNSDVTIDLTNNGLEVHHQRIEPWRITLVDTGPSTLTGGRIFAIRKYLGDESFMLTYGDGLANIDLLSLLATHKRAGKVATVTAVRPLGRFGNLNIGQDGCVNHFIEKPEGDGTWINGGFFVAESQLFNYIDGNVSLEREPLRSLTQAGQLHSYHHDGFWQPMDTLREKQQLESLWQEGVAPWKIWD